MKQGFQRVKVDGEFYEICRRAAARQEIQARYRRGGRPHRRARRHRRPASPTASRPPELADGIAIAEFADKPLR
jgi:hypothetical protein